MHAIKSAWVGQTFALANHNESKGKKTRIRRSKEERKEMVESFVKKYQKLNNGNFPSLNLTHKEVGGSFYTVREIVRDIIQENRVLGPAMFSPEGQSSYQSLEQDPLGSIAIDPQTSDEKHLEHNNIQDAIEETLLVSNVHYTRTEHQMVDNVLFINGSQVDIQTNGSTELSAPELQISELPASEQIIEQELTKTVAKVTPATTAAKQIIEQELTIPIARVTPATADVIVETFPLRPVIRTSNRIGDDSEEYMELNNNVEQEMQMLESEQSKERFKLNGLELMKNSNSVEEKFEDVNGIGNIMVCRNSGFGDEKEEKNLGDTLVEISKQTSHEEHVGHTTKGCTEPQDGTSCQTVITATTIEQSQIAAGSERASVQSGFNAKNLMNNHAEESKTIEKGLENVHKHSSNGHLGGGSQRRNNPTLERINLESWDGAPKNSLKQAANPFVAIFKAFVDALVKFWSE